MTVAPSLMQPRILTAAQSHPSQSIASSIPTPYPLLRLPSLYPQTASSLAILESVPRLASLSVAAPVDMSQPSLYRGFKATIPSSEVAKQRRRAVRGGLVDEELGNQGLKRLGDRARGLLGNEVPEEVPSRRKKRREGRRVSGVGLLTDGKLFLEDLVQQADEIAQDKENLHVRTVRCSGSRGLRADGQSLIHAEISEVFAKIDALEAIRRRLESSLLRLQEEQLELDDELEGVQELMTNPAVTSAAGTKAIPEHMASPVKSSRRRRGPAFLPSEHDTLPAGVAFMVRLPGRSWLMSRHSLVILHP